jgi:hypothetical protein
MRLLLPGGVFVRRPAAADVGSQVGSALHPPFDLGAPSIKHQVLRVGPAVVIFFVIV